MNNINKSDTGKVAVEPLNVAQPKDAKPAAAGRESGKAAPSVRDSERSAPTPPAEEKRVEQAVARLNDYVQSLQRDLRFAVDADSGRSIVTVIDRGSQEVIRQIPSETALTLARNLKDFAEQADVDPKAESIGSVGSSLGLINTRI